MTDMLFAAASDALPKEVRMAFVALQLDQVPIKLNITTKTGSIRVSPALLCPPREG